MSTPPTPPPKPKEETTFSVGQTTGHSNQFTIERLLGRGGFGEVFLANESRAKRRVAIKTMLASKNGDPRNLRRFKAEYTLGSLLSHPSLVTMFDLCESPTGIHYIVMEFIEGETLSARMFNQEKVKGHLGIDSALHVGWQIGSLFSQLHERRIIHRDLKPGNIMVVKDPTIYGGERYKLIDFGIAKLLDKDQAKSLQVENNTTTGNYMGTVPMMSPESFKGGKYQGPESDVYALGCMLYRMVAGNYPFGSESSLDVIMHHINAAPTPLTAEDPLVPHDVADIIHSMLAKDPAQRPTMAQVCEFFARKLGLTASVAAKIVIRGGTSELQAVLGDFSTGTVGPTASGSLSLEVLDNQSIQRGQLDPLPATRLSQRRQRNMLGAAIGVAALLAIGTVVLLRVGVTAKPVGTTIPLRSASTALSAGPDLGSGPMVTAPSAGPVLDAANANPATADKPSATIPTNTDGKLPTVEKKRKKKKDRHLFNE